MAQNTPSSGTGIRPYRTPYGHFPIRGYQQTTNSTFVEGHLVEMNTSTEAHRVTSASSNSSRYLGVAGEAGSSQAASGSQDGQRVIPVYEARPEIEFMGWLGAVIASTLVGQVRGFHRDSTLNIDVISSLSTGAARLEITEVGGDSGQSAKHRLASIDDTNGYVAFRFLPHYTQFARPGPALYTVEYAEPDLNASSQTRLALSSHADFSTAAVYLFSPIPAGSSGSSNSLDYIFGECFCDTATELRVKCATGGSTLSGSTRRGLVAMFTGPQAGN